MNKQKFNNVVLNPENITSEDKASLKNLAKSFPYSQIVHSLVAKAHAPDNSAEYKKLVGIAAMYATDRQILKDLVTQKKIQEKAQVSIQEKVTSESQTLEKESKIVAESQKSKVNIDTSSFFEDSEMLRNAIWSDLESLRLSKEHYLDSLDHSIEVEKELKVKTPKKATTSKVKTSSKPPSTTKKETSKKETKKASSKISDEVKAAPKKAVKAKTNPAEAKAKTTDLTTKAKSTAASKTKAKKTTTTSSKTKAASKAPKKASAKTEKQATAKDNEISEQRVEIKATLKEQINIIDSFIKKEPSISSRPVKNIESDQKDLSEKSTNFGDDLISENLAQILVEQGKSQKAIDMYKKLIWKFPQKKAYFAARIEDLNK